MDAEIESLKNEIKKLKAEKSVLEEEIKNIKLREIEREKNLNNLILEVRKFQSETLNSALKEKDLQAQLITWQRIVDEMAHTINTDVFAALFSLDKIPLTQGNENYKRKALHNIKRIRDLTILIMWDLNKDRLKPPEKLIEVDLVFLLNSQIDTIKDGIESLRLSIREHREKLLNLEIPITSDENCIVMIHDNIEPALELIIKDLLRNAFQNTDEKDPRINIKVENADLAYYITISNNRLISEEEIKWFNNNEEFENISMSKSSKVGLRLVKRWAKNLKLRISFSTDNTSNFTSVRILIPKEIRYENL